MDHSCPLPQILRYDNVMKNRKNFTVSIPANKVSTIMPVTSLISVSSERKNSSNKDGFAEVLELVIFSDINFIAILKKKKNINLVKRTLLHVVLCHSFRNNRNEPVKSQIHYLSTRTNILVLL